MTLLIVVPIVTGVLAIAVLSTLSERRHTASATISISDATAASLDPTSAAARIDDFSLALTGPTVANIVAEETGMSVAEVREGFAATRSGSGVLVDVEFVASHPEDAINGLELGVRSALVTMAEANLERSQLALVAAERHLGPAEEEMLAIEDRVGTSDLEVEYRERSSDILQLRNTIANAFNEPERTAALTELLEEKEAERDALGEELAAWQDAQRRFDSGVTAQLEAQRDVYAIEAARDRSANYQLRPIATIESDSVLGAVALPTVAAMLVAFGVVLVAAITSGRSDERRPPETSRSQPASQPDLRQGAPRPQRSPDSRAAG
jgi:hypothetical protein